jgi:DNA-binding MarR family transcriptional regulator
MFERELLQGLAQSGHPIRAKHGAVLANVDGEGTRLTELARRAGIGKPALGELVDELEDIGLVERIPDPTDGRAKLVVPTEAGSRAIAAAARVITGIESDYQASLGAASYTQLRTALLNLAPHEDADIQPRFGFELDNGEH